MLGDRPETLRSWVRQARIDAGDRPATTTEEARRVKELEKGVREPRRADTVLRSAWAFLAAETDHPSRWSATTSTNARRISGSSRSAPSLPGQGAGPPRPPDSRHPQPARSVSDAALEEKILVLRSEPFNATLGPRRTWRLPSSRQEGPGWPGAPWSGACGRWA